MKTAIALTIILVALASCQNTVTAPAPVIKSPNPGVAPAQQPASPAPPKFKPYPLDKCLVSDEPLDEWDEMQTIVHQGQEMKFCCRMCLKDFNKEPEKYLALLPEN